MFLSEIKNRNRRDFTGTITCESCDHSEELRSGYDDEYYHNEVIPNMKCTQCGESTNTLEIGIRTRPQFPDSKIM